METVDDRTFKQKVKDVWVKGTEKVSDAARNAKTMVMEHPQEALTIAVLALPASLKLANSIVRAKQQSKETRYNECDVYDPRTGTHYYTKKPLTNQQKLNLESRYRAGEDKGKILYDMKLL